MASAEDGANLTCVYPNRHADVALRAKVEDVAVALRQLRDSALRTTKGKGLRYATRRNTGIIHVYAYNLCAQEGVTGGNGGNSAGQSVTPSGLSGGNRTPPGGNTDPGQGVMESEQPDFQAQEEPLPLEPGAATTAPRTAEGAYMDSAIPAAAALATIEAGRAAWTEAGLHVTGDNLTHLRGLIEARVEDMEAAARKVGTCAGCEGPMDILEPGQTTHDEACEEKARAKHDAAPTATPAPATGTRPAPHPHLVLGVDGRAYGPGGEVITLPRSLAEIGNAGDLAALALELNTRRLYVPRAARAALGLPAEIPLAESVRAGYPHQFTEATDPAQWDIWPGDPVGLAGWLDVYRQPRERHEGVSLAFPEWMAATPALAGLPPAGLARALDLIHAATTHHGEGRGGVAFHRSPAKTFGRLLDKAARRSRHGTPEAVTLPEPYDRNVKRPRGAPAIRVPGPHTAPPCEVPAGWVLARLDVRKCYTSAAASTRFGVGEAEHRKAEPGTSLEVGNAPGLHLAICRGDAAVIHPALMPWLPEAHGRRDVLAWLDTTAVRWLADAAKAGHGVPFQVLESWTWAEGPRIFDSITDRFREAGERLEADGSEPALAAAAVIKAAANTFLGGWLASDFGGTRSDGDWQHNPAWWLTVRTQAEVRKQRNLLPMIAAGAVVLGEQNVDSVFIAAPSREALEALPGTGKTTAIADGRGKFKLEAITEVTPELAAVLADPKGTEAARKAAVKAALGEGSDQ